MSHTRIFPAVQIKPATRAKAATGEYEFSPAASYERIAQKYVRSDGILDERELKSLQTKRTEDEGDLDQGVYNTILPPSVRAAQHDAFEQVDQSLKAAIRAGEVRVSSPEVAQTLGLNPKDVHVAQESSNWFDGVNYHGRDFNDYQREVLRAVGFDRLPTAAEIWRDRGQTFMHHPEQYGFERDFEAEQRSRAFGLYSTDFIRTIGESSVRISFQTREPDAAVFLDAAPLAADKSLPTEPATKLAITAVISIPEGNIAHRVDWPIDEKSDPRTAAVTSASQGRTRPG